MRILLLPLLLGLSTLVSAQSLHFDHYRPLKPSFFENDTLPNPRRQRLVLGVVGGGYTVIMGYMGFVWYANEDLGNFHFFDDRHEWKQIDKGGHMLGAYHGTRFVTDLLRWSGMEKRRAVLTGGAAGFLAMSSIEVFDGFGETWGFSWSDIGANFAGASLAVANQLLWNEDRLQLKVSYRRSPYAQDTTFADLFGRNWPEWVLKDYNGHTLWLSVRVHSFLPPGKLRQHYPPWLNLAIGYGAEGLEGGYEDPLSDWRTREYRQWYLGFDVDLMQLRPQNGYLNTLIHALGFVKIPLPALRQDRQGLRLRALE
ncbi:MAG: DUF2279 domain-containing protein [Bacteroidetes bacterium]|nr:MAG: DUF2279 domain-containing protein [Bacteroidota bacterium]